MMTSDSRENEVEKRFEAAVVGMHGRFPEAIDIREFWENLSNGKDVIKPVPLDRWDWKPLFDSSVEQGEKTYANCGGFMPYVDCFDSKFFGILPREAESMDPQQRLFLQTSWAALEDAGYAPESLSGRKVGVFVGVGHADYPTLMRQDGAVFDMYRATGIAGTCIANRVSFTLNLCGPSATIDTACSSSLVAIHRAIQSMAAGECEIAIAGGVNLLLGPELFIAFAKTGMLSRTGRCRTFDAEADGYVRGEGVAAIVLCPLKTAKQNRDYIYGVILGSAENHGGRAHSFTAPNVEAQTAVIQEAWHKSGLSFRQASIIETHGTATPLGDPIEINALKKVWKEAFSHDDIASRSSPTIALGALKSHIGHLEAAAGIAGLIKTLLAMQYQTIPKNLHYRSLNQQINMDGTPFVVPSSPMQLDEDDLVAGVSSFGFGGVNAHVTVKTYRTKVEVAKNTATSDLSTRPFLVPLSAKDSKSLLARAKQLATYLEDSYENITVSSVDKSSMLAVLCTALDIPVPSSDTKPLALASLGLSIVQWNRVLQKIAVEVELSIDISNFRDLVTIQEIAQHFASLVQSKRAIKTAYPDVLSCRVAIPPKHIHAVTMEQLVYGLKHGRNAMEERVAIIAHGKRDLLSILHRFLISSDEMDPSWIRGSIRNKSSTFTKPSLPMGWPEVKKLKSWSEYWVNNKNAILRWEELCPDMAVPSKIPLPAYPFHLERIWYQKNSSNKHNQHEPSESVTQQIPEGLVASWMACCKSSRLSYPSSLMSLVDLLEHLAERGHDKTIFLKDVVFSRPSNLINESFVYHVAKRDAFMEIQSQTLDHKPLSLIQAKIVSSHTHEPVATDYKNITGSKPDDLIASTFYDILSNAGLTLPPPFQCIESLQVSPGFIEVQVYLSKLKVRDGLFWSTLLSTILGCIYFLQSHKQVVNELLLPWKIESLAFNPNVVKKISKVTVVLDSTSHVATICALGENSAVALAINSMQLRSNTVAEPSKMNQMRYKK